MKTILNKKLCFLFLLLGTVLSVNAQSSQTLTESFCQGFSTARNYAVDTAEGTNGTPGSTYSWSITGTNSNTAVLSAPTGNPITINWAATPAGSYVVHVVETITATSCFASEKTLAVTINALTTSTITAGGATTFCSGGSVTLTASSGNSYLWSSGEITQSISPSTTGNYSVTVTNASGCSSTSSAIPVTVNTTASPTASAQTFCSGATVANLVATGTGIKWYANSSGGTELLSSDILVSGTTYYASQTLNSCESTRTSALVTVNTSAAPTASAQTFCSGATVANLVATGTGIKWYANSSGGTELLSTDNLVTGTTYYASQTLNSCESSRTSALVTVNTSAAPTTSSQTFCSGATVANLVATGTGIKWYANSSGGTQLLSTDILTGTTYYASQTLNSCESSRTPALATVNALPTTSAIFHD